MELLQRYKTELAELNVNGNDKVLIAASGGLDSMVLLDLSCRVGLKIVVAHVNYNKRGEDSLKDEQLVREYCLKNKLSFESISVEQSLDNSKDGFQAEARKFRYAWFEKLRGDCGCDFIFTAHHLNDRIETLFINLLRGAGLKGLKSIPRKKGKIRRPLLSFERIELEKYADEQELPWRQDMSNFSDKYLRNKIRLGLTKEFKDLSARSEQNAGKSMDFLAEADGYFQELAKSRIQEFNSSNGIIAIEDDQWNQLFREKPLHKYVFDELGFYPEQLNRLEHFQKSQSGKKIEGRSSMVYRDRERFLIEKIDESQIEIFHVMSPEGKIEKPIQLSWQIVKNVNTSELKNPNLAYLNLSKLSFPLTLRPWEDGDRFKPYGMSGNKKLSDFLIDIKLSTPEKNNTYVLLSGSEIVWVVGYRVSEDYAVHDADKAIIRFEQNP